MTNFKWLSIQIYYIVILFSSINLSVGYAGRKYTKEDLIKLREEVREMFNHAYSGYLNHAFPYDELRPLTCDGVDTWGSYSLTLIDALDTLAVMGNYSEFRRVVDIVVSKANFDANINVSVFETNIRIVGGLLSAHLMSQRAGVELEPGWPCNGPLLRLAEDVARRLVAAFDTSTGMPYGTVNLRHGVPPGETSITCTAAVGTFILEFGTLSRLTGDPLYEEVALNALYALYNHRSPIGLYGNHIDVMTGRWTAQDSGIGAGVDSYLEYLVKGALLVQRPELIAIFNEGRVAIDKYLKRNDWYLWVSMHKGQVTLPVFQSLEAYWPGVLSLIGDISEGMKSLHNYHQVWKQYGFTPEFYNIAQGQVGTNRDGYPLRPELIESTMYLYRATGDPYLLDVGLDILRSIQHSSRTKCGYATIKDVRDHSLENRMESFFLAETTKYLYLLFDPDNFIHNNGQQGTVHTLPSGRECILDAGGYIFNTEAHPIDPGALLCCSENFDEPKRFNKEAARGDKLTTFARVNQIKPSAVESQLDSSDHKELQEEDLPSAFTDEEPMVSNEKESFDKLKESGAVDVINVPPPSEGEIRLVNNGGEKRLSLFVLQMIERLTDTNMEEYLMKTAWSRDLLRELLDIIHHGDEILNRKKRDLNEYENIPGGKSETTNLNSGMNEDSEEEVAIRHPETKNVTRLSSVDNSNELFEDKNSDLPQLIGQKIVQTDYDEKDARNNSENKAINMSNQVSSELNNGLPEDSIKTAEENNEKSLFELLMIQKFNRIKKVVLMEADSIMYHLIKCLENLETTKIFDEVIDNTNIRIQFYTRRLEVSVLANNIMRTLEETKNILNTYEVEQTVSKDLLKRLIELVIDAKTVKKFIDDYHHFMKVTKLIIDIEKEKHSLEKGDGNEIGKEHSSEEESINNSEKDTNENEESKNNYSNEDSGNLLQSDSWKADEISYQVDDKDRGDLTSKVDNKPLFTDKLKIKAETVISLLPKSLVSNENTFDPQVLLERIRNSPKYYRNSTWTTQYELLTCLPQPYFTRIILSGEFFSD